MDGFKNIFVSNIATALDDAKDFKPQQVISFLDVWDQALDFGIKPRHHLTFTDVDDTDDWNDKFAPTSRMVKSIVSFVKPNSRVLVHCIGGVSRSTATALSLMVMRGAEVDDAMQAVAQMRPSVWPNSIILTLFDSHMKAGGHFVKLCKQAHQRLDKRMQLWCNDCKVHFFDGDNCPGKH